MALDDAALAEIERLYRDGELTLVEIGRRFDRSAAGISKLARSRGWPMRSEVMGRAPRVSGLSTPKARAKLADRLCNAITKKLEQMEKGMKSGELGSADFERDAKAVAAMIGGMEKVAATVVDADEARQPKSASAGTRDEVGCGPGAGSGEAERLRREIIERFERIQRRRNAEAGSE
jgi:hypothetical protein